MATNNQVYAFINDVLPFINFYGNYYGVTQRGIILAQFITESMKATGLSTLASKYHNYAGMKCGSKWKGASVNLNTKEEYTAGQLIGVTANFRVYESIEAGVKGYFDFLTGYSRYKKVVSALTPLEYATELKNAGWATSSNYVNSLMKNYNKYNLHLYEIEDTQKNVESDLLLIASQVINGQWGNGAVRKEKLTLAGYDYAKVQAKVNYLLKQNDK